MEWWLPKVDPALADSLAQHLDISRILAKILATRGFEEPGSARRFLRPRIDDLHDPFVLKDMDVAVSRTLKAIIDRERVMVYGHDDPDGITATALLVEVLRGLGADVRHYIPDRYNEGIGLNREMLDNFADQGVDLIVTVDCSVSDKEDCADGLKAKAIITDHHEVSEPLAGVMAFINPKRKDSSYPCKGLAGVGVAFKLAQALLETRGESIFRLIEQVGDLVALGTLADRVPQTDENRVLTRLGLTRAKGRPGFSAVARRLGLPDSLADSKLLWRRAISLISSAQSREGRSLGCELLLTKDRDLAQEIAGDLHEANLEWQELVQKSFTRISGKVEQASLRAAPMIVVVDEEAPIEVIGTCAAKLANRYHRPAMVMSFWQDRYFGETRAPKGYNLMSLLEQSRDLLADYGGHLQAAGLSIFPEDVDVFLKRIFRFTENWPKGLPHPLKIDAEVDLSELEPEVVDELLLLAPYARGNPKPLLLSRGVRMAPLDYGIEVGGYRQIAEVSGIEVLMERNVDEWRLGELFGSSVDIAYSVVDGGKGSVQILLRDFRKSRGLD